MLFLDDIENCLLCGTKLVNQPYREYVFYCTCKCCQCIGNTVGGFKYCIFQNKHTDLFKQFYWLAPLNIRVEVVSHPTDNRNKGTYICLYNNNYQEIYEGELLWLQSSAQLSDIVQQIQMILTFQ
jgi:hypothetical protein